MTLKVDIFARNMEISEKINDYINRKVARLDRFLTDIDETRVDIAFVKSARNLSDRHVVQITIRGRGYILRAEERADDIFEAVDKAMEKIQRQIERFKGKRQRGRGDGTSAAEVVPATPPEEENENQEVIVRRKQFTLLPMNEEEAIEQMSLLGHDNFFVFYNANTSKLNVLYRRRDGTLGLIEPLLG